MHDVHFQNPSIKNKKMNNNDNNNNNNNTITQTRKGIHTSQNMHVGADVER